MVRKAVSLKCELDDFTVFHNFVHAYFTSRCELSRFILTSVLAALFHCLIHSRS